MNFVDGVNGISAFHGVLGVQVTVRGLIQATADDIEDSGRDDLSGHGVINPLRMLAAR